MTQYKISQELMGAIFNYLKSRPFQEVVGLIQGLQKAEEMKPPPELAKALEGIKDKPDVKK